MKELANKVKVIGINIVQVLYFGVRQVEQVGRLRLD